MLKKRIESPRIRAMELHSTGKGGHRKASFLLCGVTMVKMVGFPSEIHIYKYSFRMFERLAKK